MDWSENQKSLIRFAGDDRQAVYAVGPTQSGKSVALAHSFVCYILANDWPEGRFDGFAVMGPSMEQVKSMLSNMEASAEALGIRCDVAANGNAKMAGHNIQGVSIANQGSRKMFHGKRFGAVLIDEVTICDKETIQYAEGRVNVAPKGKATGKLFTATNPESPHHWWKRERVDRDKAAVVNSSIEDNPSLSEEYKAELRSKWAGAILERMYYGRWAAHSGLVYPFFEKQCLVDAPDIDPVRFDLSVDHATATVTHALLWAVYPNHRRVVDEWRHNGAVNGWKTTGNQAQDIKEWIGVRRPSKIYCDPAAPHMALDLAETLGIDVYYAENDVLPGIQQCMVLMEQGQLSVDRSCQYTIFEMGAYQWDSKAEQRGDPDKPVKVDDHAPDSFRYYVHSEMQQTEVKIRKME